MNQTIIAILCFVIIIAGCKSAKDAALENLAACLAEKGIHEYGAFWCPHCANQAKMFGDGDKILKARGVYIECDPRCVRDAAGKLPIACNGMESYSDICKEKGVKQYPTWEFTDGTVSGEQLPSVLAERAGCAFTE